MSQQYIFTIEHLTRIYDETAVLEDIWLAFFPGAKIGVIGNNGAGKSTLLRIMAGEDTDFMGEARPAKGIKIGYFPQEPLAGSVPRTDSSDAEPAGLTTTVFGTNRLCRPRLDPEWTVQECIDEAVAEPKAILDRYNEVNMAFAEASPEEMEKLLEEQQELQDKIDSANLWELDRTLDIACDAMRLPPMDTRVEHLSGGELRRVALCQLLLTGPDMLLLDEPTNHLDAESIAWLERFLDEFPGTVVAITHDRYFLDNVAGWILELDRGRGYPYEGNYTGWLEQKQARLAVEEKRESKRQRTLKRELEWSRMSPKARSTKNKARLERINELAGQQYDTREEGADIQIPVTRPLGDLVVRAEGLSKAFGERLLFEDLEFDLPPGGIVGVIGPNGAGKTTLFRMIMGVEQPTDGSLTIGPTVDLAHVDQSRDALDPKKTVYEEISGGHETIEIGKAKIHARAYCGRFNFKGSDQQKFVGDLSGGERNRVHLAKLLRSGGNLLLLDEPTNDLDVETLRSLEDGLTNFGGCAVVSSHDRWFLDRVATHILAFEGDSRVVWFEGNYKMYEIQRSERLGEDADRPHRIKYKPLVRS